MCGWSQVPVPQPEVPVSLPEPEVPAPLLEVPAFHVWKCKKGKTKALCRCKRKRNSKGKFIKSPGAGRTKKGSSTQKEAEKLSLSFLGAGIHPAILVTQASRTRSGAKIR